MYRMNRTSIVLINLSKIGSQCCTTRLIINWCRRKNLIEVWFNNNNKNKIGYLFVKFGHTIN